MNMGKSFPEFMAELAGKNQKTGKFANIKCKCGYEGKVELNELNIELGHVWCPDCGEKYWLVLETIES